MIELPNINQVGRTARTAIEVAGGFIEEGSIGYKVTIPNILESRDLFGDGKLTEWPLSDTSPDGFRWVPLYQLPNGQWLKVEPFDDNRRTGEHRRRLVVCVLETELNAWTQRREDYRAAGGHPRPEWMVGLAPRPWKPGESFTPGINPETVRDSVAPAA